MNELYPEQDAIPGLAHENSTTQNQQQLIQPNMQNHIQIPGQPMQGVPQPNQQQAEQQPRGIEQAKQNLQLIIGGFNSMMGLVAGIMNAYLLCTTILKSVLKGLFSILRAILPIRLAKYIYRFLSRSLIGAVLRTLKQSVFPSLQTRSQENVFNNLWEEKPLGLSITSLTTSAVKAILKGVLLLSLPIMGAVMVHRYKNRKSAMLREMQNAQRQRRMEESSRQTSIQGERYYDEGWLGASLGPKSQQTLKDYKLTRVADAMQEPEELLLAEQLQDPSLRYFAPARVSMVTIKESKFFNSGSEKKREDEEKDLELMGPPNSEEQKNGDRSMLDEWLRSSHSYSGKKQ